MVEFCPRNKVPLLPKRPLLLVVRPGAPSSFLFLVVMPGARSLLLVVKSRDMLGAIPSHEDQFTKSLWEDHALQALVVLAPEDQALQTLGQHQTIQALVEGTAKDQLPASTERAFFARMSFSFHKGVAASQGGFEVERCCDVGIRQRINLAPFDDTLENIDPNLYTALKSC